jgi:hypothetical protein
MTAHSPADPERQRLRSALLEYCEQDTLGLVKLTENLRIRLSVTNT